VQSVAEKRGDTSEGVVGGIFDGSKGQRRKGGGSRAFRNHIMVRKGGGKKRGGKQIFLTLGMKKK